MTYSVLLIILGSAIGLQLVLGAVRLLRSPLRSVPGPFLARFTNGWYFWQVRKGHFEVLNMRLHDKYGPIVRYGPNRYSINSPTATTAIYAPGSQFAKSSWYSAFGNPGNWTIFGEQDIRTHAHNRKQFTSAYSMTSVVSYEPYVDECIGLLSDRLAEFAQAQGRGAVELDMGHWLQCFAFDVIALMTYAKRIGFLDRGEDVEKMMETLRGHIKYATLVGIFAWLHPLLFRLRNLLAGAKGARRSFVLRFTLERIAEYRSLPKAVSIADLEEKEDDLEEEGGGTINVGGDAVQAKPFLAKFFAKYSQNPGQFTMEHLVLGCTSNMVAGSDTTTIGLSSTLYFLLKNRACLERLREEIAAQGVGQRYLTFKETQDMPYLQAVIKEALRMHPAAGLPLERVVPKGGATICEQFFPEGTIVGVQTWVEHQNPAIFGSDAGKFRPERWLIDDQEELGYMNRHWMPFGVGSRTCIGRHVSHLEMAKLIPVLVRDFDFELAGDLARPGAEWETRNFWFVKPRGFAVKVKTRVAGART